MELVRDERFRHHLMRSQLSDVVEELIQLMSEKSSGIVYAIRVGNAQLLHDRYGHDPFSDLPYRLFEILRESPDFLDGRVFWIGVRNLWVMFALYGGRGTPNGACKKIRAEGVEFRYTEGPCVAREVLLENVEIEWVGIQRSRDSSLLKLLQEYVDVCCLGSDRREHASLP